MREISKLLEAVAEVRAVGKKAAIATVVRVRGSAYRREGTKMLIEADGTQVCMISGGCLEQEVGEIAQEVMATGRPQVRFFDLDEDVVWGLGLGCGGSVDVYIEPFDEGAAHAGWLEAVREQRSACLATVIEASEGSSLQPGARMFVAEDGATVGQLGDPALESQLIAQAAEAGRQLYPRSQTRSYRLEDGATLDVFLDVNAPPPELVLFGAGHDAIPLASFGRSLGFEVTVIDARPAFLTAERFPGATLVRTHPSGFGDRVALGPRSFVVVMNHHLERDQQALDFALAAPVSYLGVLGPRSRFDRMVAALAEEGRTVTAEERARVRNPIGVDVGADTPEEIAVSILAELLAVRGGYPAGFLSGRSGPIHRLLERA